MHIRENILLLQGYYKQLQLGKFMEEIIKHNDLSFLVQDFQVKTGEHSHFTISSSAIKKTLQDIYNNKDKTNLFGYLTEINTFRGILGSMRELINQGGNFHDFLKTTLGKQYFAFEQVIFFTRNILSHNSTSGIKIDANAIKAQKQFLSKNKIKTIHFIFVYSKYIKQRKGSNNYGVEIKLHFPTIKAGKSLFEVVSVHQLYKLCELCYNLSEIFRSKYKIK
ncbi:MAG: hypothetical protein CR971_02770 [candidate division SR1 bacterium]|nr:MAG: hypothetical protein CR971_02770 [candidate division SR1 bacterium]